MIQIAGWLGSGIGSVVIQIFVRVREQVYSNLIGLHVMTGLPATEQATAQLAGLLVLLLPPTTAEPANCIARSLICGPILVGRPGPASGRNAAGKARVRGW